jgi:undecaprenyl-diphosphatase
LIGLAQSVSIVPGVSRSAATILGALFLGAKRGVAVEFSFLLAVPTMLAASGYDLLKSNMAFSTDEWTLIAVGFIGSFITALIVVRWFIKFVQTNTFIPFGIYRIILALLFLVFLL